MTFENTSKILDGIDNDENLCFGHVVVVYDAKSAHTAAGDLATFLRLQGKNVMLLSADEYTKLKKNHQLNTFKVIILGHHSLSHEQLQKNDYFRVGKGVKIGYNPYVCVLRANRSDLPPGKNGRKKFAEIYNQAMVEYQNNCADTFQDVLTILGNKIHFNDDQKTKKSMYTFLWISFVMNGFLDSFLEMEQPNQPRDKKDVLCDSLAHNMSYHKHITPDVLNAVYQGKSFIPSDFWIPFNHTDKDWEDLYKTTNDIWHIQRHKNRRYCRILNLGNKKEVLGTVEQIICPILNHCRRQEHLEKLQHKEWGIVFCGGGGKGSYQLGVWKWLIDHNVSEKISGVSGASVGALNSLLFVEGDYDHACKIWKYITSDIIVDDKKLPLYQSQKKLEELLDENMDKMEKILTTDKMVYSSVTCVNGLPLKAIQQILNKGVALTKHGIKAEYFCWVDRDKTELKNIVLASAAVPVIKKAREIEGKWFVDGGLADNVPVQPLVEDGFKNIIVVHLGQKEDSFKKAIALLDTSGTTFHHVWPSKPLGDMREAGAAKVKALMDYGYQDADKQLKNLLTMHERG